MESQLGVILHAVLSLQPRPGVGALVPGVFWVVGVVCARLVLRPVRVGPENTPRRVARVVRTMPVVAGLFVALGTVGTRVAAMAAGLGLTGIAPGLALRAILAKATAGVLILVYRRSVRGDCIDLRYAFLVKDERHLLFADPVIFREKLLLQTPSAS